MALYIPHSIFHLARLLYVRPENFGPYYVVSSTLILNLELDGSVWLTSRPGRFTSRRKKTPCQLNRRLSGPQSRYTCLEYINFILQKGFETRTAHPVA